MVRELRQEHLASNREQTHGRSRDPLQAARLLPEMRLGEKRDTIPVAAFFYLERESPPFFFVRLNSGSPPRQSRGARSVAGVVFQGRLLRSLAAFSVFQSDFLKVCSDS